MTFILLVFEHVDFKFLNKLLAMFCRKKDVYKFLLPNLLDTQRISYCWFLEFGFVQELEKFPLIRDSFDERELNLSSRFYKISQPNYTLTEAKRRDTTYSVRVYTRGELFYLNSEKKTEKNLRMCDIPLMTNEGTFLVNGIQRIIINQIVRSPGIYYNRIFDKKGGFLYTASLISNRGTWIKFEMDTNDEINVKINKVKKISSYVFLKTFGFKDHDFLKFDHPNYFRVTIDKYLKTSKKFKKVCLSSEDAFLELHEKLRQNEVGTVDAGRYLLYSRFLDPKKYDLGRFGRSRINKRLNHNKNKEACILTSKDVFYIINALINFRAASTREDDIDHLGNRRVRSVGELLQHQIRIGLDRLERISQERMERNCLRLSGLLNSTPLVSSIREFFGSNPLSQFMDQTNPLAELTHKRKLSVLGPGGISKDQAGFAIRDLHPSQYGRICPIETPEGPTAGLVGSLAIYSRVNSDGFIETPFYKVEKGKVRKNAYPVFLDATTEDKYNLASGDVEIDKNGFIRNKIIPVRYRQEFISVLATEVDYIAISPIQVLSLATSLIPFLEHDDANRILMGSNMQRQAVPLLYPGAPLIGTGLESQTARDAGMILLSTCYGKVRKITEGIIILADTKDLAFKYKLTKYQRSNQATCINQRPFIAVNEKVYLGQILADGASTDGGELAVGQNIVVAYMPWEGYNYEDAFVISERLLYDDLFTSLHIETFEVEIRQTKRGMEEVTKDLPNIRESAIRHLDANGIVKIGTWVTSGDILVGKTTPKGKTIYSPEANLIIAITGKKLSSVRNTSLKLPDRMFGRVIDIKFFSRNNCDALPQGTEGILKVYIAQARKIKIGDKMAGRHGNKGIISKILPRQDMPYLPDGTIIDIMLNPLGVPSRMNVGQIFECLLGLAAETLNVRFKIVPFDEMYGAEASRALVHRKLKEASVNKPWFLSDQHPGKMILRDGRTSQFFENPITIGFSYMLKLIHLVDDKIHARSTGPYSLVTQQPLGGRSKQGGQRLGEMEVWALEAFGAAYSLQELLTLKSDDIQGRNKTLASIVKGLPIPRPGIPESFKVLMRELQALCLDIATYKLDTSTEDEQNVYEVNLFSQNLSNFDK